MRRVLVVSDLYDRPEVFTGGHIHRLSLELSTRGLAVKILCPVPRFDRGRGPLANLAQLAVPARRMDRDGLDVWYVPYANLPLWVSPRLEISNLARRLRRHSPAWSRDVQLVHAHRLVPTAAAALHLGRALGVPVVASARGSDVHTHPQRDPRIRKTVAEVLEKADGLTAVSRALARQLEQLGPASRAVDVVYNGVDSERFRPRDRDSCRCALGLAAPGTGFVSVARLERAKGVFELLEAFERLARENGEAWLAILGPGPEERSCRQRIHEAGLEGRVFIPGAVAHGQVPRWLGAADVFVLASHAEGMPNVVLEAMASGLPVIATNVGGTREVVDPRTGVLVPPGNVPALEAAMSDLSRSSRRREELGSAGRARVEAEFTWAKCAEGMEAVYERVLSEGRGRHRTEGERCTAS